MDILPADFEVKSSLRELGEKVTMCAAPDPKLTHPIQMIFYQFGSNYYTIRSSVFMYFNDIRNLHTS
jgi:hypothetical protein